MSVTKIAQFLSQQVFTSSSKSNHRIRDATKFKKLLSSFVLIIIKRFCLNGQFIGNKVSSEHIL